ncbi:MAG: hypothetical protein ACFB50_10210 [Rubrobacteraceae bacterium]
MIEVMLFVNIGLLVIGSVTLTLAVVVLQRARGYVELAEKRLELLRQGQERSLSILRELQHSGGEVGAHQETPVPAVRERKEQREAEVKIARLEKELQDIRNASGSGIAVETGSTRSENNPGGEEKTSGYLAVKEPVTFEDSGDVRASPPVEVREPSPAGGPNQDSGKGETGFVVRHAHPDDDVNPRKETANQSGAQGSPIKMFQEHYHRYLENYEGYVKLIERLCKLRDEEQPPAGSPADREWQQRVGRLQDGIQRTTGRLDILEQYNPDLASDERVSRRAEIAQSYSALEKRLPGSESF